MPVRANETVVDTVYSFVNRTDGTTSKSISRPVILNTVTVGSSRPGWQDLIARHANAATNYSRTIVSNYGGGHGMVSDFNYVGGKRVEATGIHKVVGTVPSFSWPASQADTCSNRALARLKQKLQADTLSWDGMAPVAEVKELRGLINQTANAAQTMLKGMIAIKRGNFRDAAARASDLWLGFNFGVKPLIHDTQDAIAAVGKSLDDDYVKRYSGRGSMHWTSRATGSSSLITRVADYTAHISHDVSVTIVAGLHVNLTSANNYGRADHLGFMPSDIIPTAWELVPYSWAVDYFANVGEYLSDSFFQPPGQTIYCCQMTKYTQSVSTSFKVRNAPSGLISGFIGPYQMERIDFRRSTISALPHTKLMFNTVDRIGSHGVNKVLNLAAVLAKK